MFDVSWSEMAVIGIVTLIVVGPKDLPKVMRGMARLTAQARGLAGEFRRGLDDIAREAEFAELEKKLEEMKSAQMKAVLGDEPPVTPAGMAAIEAPGADSAKGTGQ